MTTGGWETGRASYRSKEKGAEGSEERLEQEELCLERPGSSRWAYPCCRSLLGPEGQRSERINLEEARGSSIHLCLLSCKEAS